MKLTSFLKNLTCAFAAVSLSLFSLSCDKGGDAPADDPAEAVEDAAEAVGDAADAAADAVGDAADAAADAVSE